jgi:hypothetical protein
MALPSASMSEKKFWYRRCRKDGYHEGKDPNGQAADAESKLETWP